MIDITDWPDERVNRYREEIISNINLWFKDMEFVKGCGEKCKVQVSIYPDIDNDDEFSTFVKLPRKDYVEIISLKELEQESSILAEIEQKYEECQRNIDKRGRHRESLKKLDGYLKFYNLTNTK